MSQIVQFLRAIPQAQLPERADKSALGTLPIRAVRHCAAITSASAFGWHVYPPTSISFRRTGDEVSWTCDELDGEWLQLSDAAQFPDFAQAWNDVVPPAMRGFSPPFLTALAEPGAVQVWTGLMARTAPGWNLLIRPPANLPRTQQHAIAFYEGFVETDRWFGPLFINLRLIADAEVTLRRIWPLIQVQAIPRTLLTDPGLARADTVPDLAAWTADDWSAYEQTVVRPNTDPARQVGAYAGHSRREARRAGAGGCPVHGDA